MNEQDNPINSGDVSDRKLTQVIDRLRFQAGLADSLRSHAGTMADRLLGCDIPCAPIGCQPDDETSSGDISLICEALADLEVNLQLLREQIARFDQI